ncbi:hypothetical protein [Rhodococcus sp. ACPA1]|uniref:hypothetical protein n=1 Tax=Rhodococcus sp. ACPA1 TaxID=2028572 RepID=UPI00117B8B66|nr:hypothetical protein [Rhodococcus sp. ACPA1]
MDRFFRLDESVVAAEEACTDLKDSTSVEQPERNLIGNATISFREGNAARVVSAASRPARARPPPQWAMRHADGSETPRPQYY